MRAIRKYFQKYWKYKIQQTKEELNTMKIGNDIYYVHIVTMLLLTITVAVSKVIYLWPEN